MRAIKENKTPELESFDIGDLVSFEIYYPETVGIIRHW